MVSSSSSAFLAANFTKQTVGLSSGSLGKRSKSDRNAAAPGCSGAAALGCGLLARAMGLLGLAVAGQQGGGGLDHLVGELALAGEQLLREGVTAGHAGLRLRPVVHRPHVHPRGLWGGA